MQDHPGEELSARELEILRLVATGATNRQVARTLFISPNTVKTHLRNIFSKIGVESRTEATLYAVQQGLVDVGLNTRDDSPVEEQRDEETRRALLKMLQWARTTTPSPWLRPVTVILAVALATLLMVWPAGGLNSAMQPMDRLSDDSSLSGVGGQAAGLSRWGDRSPMISAAGRFGLAMEGDNVYLIGGAGQSGVTGTVQVYNVAQDVWGMGKSKPTPVSNVGAATVGGRIYVPGGLDAEGNVLDTLEIYDPRMGQWTTGPSLPVGLCSYAIAPDDDGFYLFGGWDGAGYVDAVYHYGVGTARWERVATLSRPRGFAAAATADGIIYLLGGYDGAQELDSCEAFHVDAAWAGRDPWERLSDMPEGRAGHAVAAGLGNLYVLGGGWQRALSESARYDIGTDSWGTIPSPISDEWRTLGAASVDTSSGLFVYAFGGWSGAYLADVYAYQAFYRLYLP
ncbi:MAG: hypothetical protein GXX94_08325 [Chloroflexi bacterium]|nr:hypothetical protein [Chloroflexota bacterium]